MLGLTIRTAPPKVTLVFARFHLLKLLNAPLTELTRELQRKAEEGLQKQAPKGTRRLSLMHPANLDDTLNELQQLYEPLKLNASLATAYSSHHQSVGRRHADSNPRAKEASWVSSCLHRLPAPVWVTGLASYGTDESSAYEACESIFSVLKVRYATFFVASNLPGNPGGGSGGTPNSGLPASRY